MSMRLMIVSAVAAAALSGPAVAQQGGDTQVNPPNPAAPAQMQMAPAPAAPAPAPTQAPAQPSDQSSAQAPDQATTGAAGSMVAPASAEPARREPAATSQAVVSSDPIPDTRANRAKYGAPLSSAGRRSVPSGN